MSCGERATTSETLKKRRWRKGGLGVEARVLDLPERIGRSRPELRGQVVHRVGGEARLVVDALQGGAAGEEGQRLVHPNGARPLVLRAVLHGHPGVGHPALERIAQAAKGRPQLLRLETGVVPVDPVPQHLRPRVAVEQPQEDEAQGGQAVRRRTRSRARPSVAPASRHSASCAKGTKRTSMTPRAGPAAARPRAHERGVERGRAGDGRGRPRRFRSATMSPRPARATPKSGHRKAGTRPRVVTVIHGSA